MSRYQIKQYKTVHSFLKETQPILEKDVIMNTFPISSCIELMKDTHSSSFSSPYYFSSVWKRNHELIYVFTCIHQTMYIGWCGKPHHHHHHSLQQQVKDLNTIEMNRIFQLILKNAFKKMGDQLKYIFGYTPITLSMYEQWKLIIESNSSIHSPSPLPLLDLREEKEKNHFTTWCFELKSLQQLIYNDKTKRLLKTTYLRLATMNDLNLLTLWKEQFILDCNIPSNYYDNNIQQLCYQTIQKEEAYLWCDQITHEPLGTIWKRDAIQKLTITIGSVFIPKQYRSKGYAAAMVIQFSLFLLNDHHYQTLTLSMDGKRHPFHNLYASIGYLPIGSFARLCL